LPERKVTDLPECVVESLCWMKLKKERMNECINSDVF